MSPPLGQLADQASSEFAFLLAYGFTQVSCELLAEQSYRGGFTLRYAGPSRSCTIRYGDWEFECEIGGLVVFGTRTHPGFSGNMFVRVFFLANIGAGRRLT